MLEDSGNINTNLVAEFAGEVSTGGKMVSIPVVEGQPLQSGIQTVSGSIPAAILASKYQVPYRDARLKEGYQRKPQQIRISKLVGDLRKSVVDIPTAILLNIRGKDAFKRLSKDSEGRSCLELNMEDENLVLYVVDGQHRVISIVDLFEDDPEKWGAFRLQFVLMIGATVGQELRQFYVVNSTAKSVKTDLAYDLLKQQFDRDGKVMTHTIESGQKWKVDGQCLVELLNESSPLWKNKIQLVNEPKGDTIIPAASFVGSLKHDEILCGFHLFGQWTSSFR